MANVIEVEGSNTSSKSEGSPLEIGSLLLIGSCSCKKEQFPS